MSEITGREIGQLEAKVDNLDDKIEKLEKHMDARINGLDDKFAKRIKDLETKIDALSKFMVSINVGIQIIVWLGGGALTVIGFATKMFGLLK